MEDYRKEDINNAAKALEKICVQMYDNDGNFRPFNEVMIDLAASLRKSRSCMDKHQYDILRESVFTALCGMRYKNEFC